MKSVKRLMKEYIDHEKENHKKLNIYKLLGWMTAEYYDDPEVQQMLNDLIEEKEW